MDKVCKDYPKKNEEECNEFIRMHHIEVARLISEKFTAGQICFIFDVCSSTEEVFGKISKDESVKDLDSYHIADPKGIDDDFPYHLHFNVSRKCYICKLITKKLFEDVKNNKDKVSRLCQSANLMVINELLLCAY